MIRIYELGGQLLAFEEGFRSKAYLCSEGYPTIGIGWRIGPKGADLKYYTMTLTKRQAKQLLNEQIQEIHGRLKEFSWYKKQKVDRQVILLSMAFQMGIDGLLGFKKMIEALEAGDFLSAYHEALDSRWYTQTPQRAVRHAVVLEHGEIGLAYGEFIN